MGTGVWKPGDQVAVREVWDGRVWSATPAVVVQDDPDQRRFWIPAGTTMKYAVDRDQRELRLYADRWSLADRTFSRGILSFAWPDTQHVVLAMWREDGTFEGWYVNLETPVGRDDRSYDFVDHCLDVLVPADRSTWTWKDEEELAEAVRMGIFTAEEAAGFRAEGERAARRVLDREPPFDADWSGWRPDPSWPIPVLPDGWDRVGSAG
jgi:predicted RNA-binding protein associated with RNAse of E/G family